MRHDGFTVAGVILAGGRSSRMAGEDKAGQDKAGQDKVGQDKAMAMLAGAPLLVHAARRLRPQVARMALSTNGAAARNILLGVDALADADDSRPGPLAGILAGLRWAQALPSPPDALVSVAVDTPFFPGDLVERLVTAAGRGTIAVATSAGGRHPTFALWPLGLADDLAAYLAHGERRVGGFIALYPHVEVGFPAAAGGLDPFFNINTPSDLAEAERTMRSLA
jgi:molybdopterin-guanine dinucleotide biosynthesis protein A